MPISKDCASDPIVIYQPFIYRRHSGYGWKSECLKLAFPNARVVTDCSIIRGFDGIVIALRGITSENAFYRPPFYYPKEIAALSTVKGKVILYTSWEFDTLPASVSNLIPRADILVVVSKFMTELFPDSDCRIIRPPVKDLPYKVKSGRTYRIGGLIHPARRRNLQAWVELRSILPKKYRIVCVCAPEIKFDKEAKSLLEKAADELLFDLDDSQLAEFYHSLDWFISFSTGEGHGLPVREALRCGTPVLVPIHTGYEELAGLPGVVPIPTIRKAGIDHECWHGFVHLTDVRKAAAIIRETEPPQVPERLPLQTVDNYIKQWQELVHPLIKRSESKRLETIGDDQIVWLVTNTHPCGVREAATIWAERTNSIVVPMMHAFRLGKPKLVIIPYHVGYWEFYRWHLPSIVKQLKCPIVVWAHREFQYEDEAVLMTSLADAIWVTTERLFNRMNADGILPNPIGDPPTTNPEPDLIGSFGFYKHEAATLLNELALRLPEFRFEGYWTSSPFFKDPVPMELLQKAIDQAPPNCQHFVGPFKRGELHERLSRCAVFIVWNSPHAADGEMSARIALLLRMGRPILANDNSPLAQPFRKFIPLIARFDADYLTSLLLGPLDPFVPVNVPSLEEEVSIFWKLVKPLL
jgi:hypothetical protein